MLRFVPIFFLLFCLLLGFGLLSRSHPLQNTSPMVGKIPEDFSLALLGGETSFHLKSRKGKVTVVNVFASWCGACLTEHSYLMELAKHTEIIGLAWKDKPEKIESWLIRHGNPYQQVAMDPKGESTLRLGLTGVPETFVFNKNGTIVYNYKAPLPESELDDVLLPLLERLRHE